MPAITCNPGPVANAGFSPTSVTGCQLWLDGADSSSMVLNGSSVSTWNDKSGNGYNFTSVSTSPTFSQGGILFVDGTILVNSSITAFSSDNTLYLVAKATAINASGIGMIFVAGSDYTSDTYGYRILAPSAGTSTSYSWDVNPPGNGGNLNYNGTATLYVDGTTGTANMYSIYNTAVLSAPGNGSGLTGLTLSRSTYNRYYNGYIYEVLLFNSKHGTPQRQIIEGYLAQKWGLTSSLPGGHPGLTTNYISSPPRVFSLGPLTGTHAPFYVTANQFVPPVVYTLTVVPDARYSFLTAPSGTITNTGSSGSIGAATIVSATYTATAPSYITFARGTGYILAPSIAGIQTLILIVKIRDAASPSYLLDARSGLANGWLYTGGPPIGPDWASATYYRDAVNTTFSGDFITPLQDSIWHHICLQRASFTSAITFLARFSQNETLGCDCGEIMIFTGALTAQQVRDNYNFFSGRFGWSPI